MKGDFMYNYMIKSFFVVGMLFIAVACGKNDNNGQQAQVPNGGVCPAGQIYTQYGCLAQGSCPANYGWYTGAGAAGQCVVAVGVGTAGYPAAGYGPGAYPPGAYAGYPSAAYGVYGQMPYGVGYGAGISIGAGFGFGVGVPAVAMPAQPVYSNSYSEQLFYSGCGYGCQRP